MSSLSLRRILIIPIAIGAAACGWTSNLSSDDATRQDWEKNFTQNEQAFGEVYRIFKSMIPEDDNRMFLFGDIDGDYMTFTIHDRIIRNGKHDLIGGRNLPVSDKKIIEALDSIDENASKLDELIELLPKTNCDVVRTTQIRGNPIQFVVYQSDWTTFTYYIFDQPLDEEQLVLYGNPISPQSFEAYVIIHASGAL